MCIKVHNNCRNRSKGSPLWDDSLPKSGNFCDFGSCVPRAPTGVKFCTAKRTHVPISCAKFHMNRCNVSSLRGENADFLPVSKFKYRLVKMHCSNILQELGHREIAKTVIHTNSTHTDMHNCTQRYIWICICTNLTKSSL